MQGRLELLEILFASYYGVAFAHYVFHGYEWTGAAIGALVAALLLKPWKHHH